MFDLRFVDLAGFSKWFTKYLSGFQGRPRLSSCIFCICWCTLILGLSKTFDLLFNMKITKNISKVSNTFLFYSTTVVQIHNNQSINQATIASSDSFLLWHYTYLKLLYNQLEIIYMYRVHYVQRFIETRAWGRGPNAWLGWSIFQNK